MGLKLRIMPVGTCGICISVYFKYLAPRISISASIITCNIINIFRQLVLI
jgi:hypothetical protein